MKYTILLTLPTGLRWKQAAPTIGELLRLANNLRAVAFTVFDRMGDEVAHNG